MNADRKTTADELRERAEALLKTNKDEFKITELADVKQLAHELAVHQAELELQNDELRDTQLALQKAKDRFASLYENAPVGYVVLDENGVIRQNNATWLEMLNRKDEDLRGIPFSETIFAEDVPVFLARFRTFFRNPADKQIIVRFKRAGGRPFYSSIEAKPNAFDPSLTDSVKALKSELMVIVSDFSELYKAQQLIELQNQELKKINEHKNRLNAILRAIRNVNQLITHEENCERLIQGACDSLTEELSYQNAWIALLDESGKTIVASSQSELDLGFATMKKQLIRGEYPQCMMHALESDEVLTIRDTKTECEDCPAAGRYMDRSALIRSLRYGESVYGIIAVSIPPQYADDIEERSLFAEVAGDLAFALHKIEISRHLQLSRKRYRELFENSRDGFMIVDGQGRFIEANQAFCAMLGYTLNELKKLPNFIELTPESWREWESKEIWQKNLLKQGFTNIYEKEYIRKDGSVFPVELRLHVVSKGNDEIDYLWGIVRDITERKQIQERLNEVALRLNEAIDAAHVGLWDWDLKTNRVRYSAEWKRQIGYKDDEISDSFDEWEKRVHPDDLESTIEKVQQSINDRSQKYFVEFRFCHKNGTYRWIHAQSTVLCDQEGIPVRVVGSHLDITERKKIEEALREREEFLRTIYRTTCDGFMLLDSTGHVYEANEAYCLMSGYTRDELIGMSISDLDAEEEPEDTSSRIERIMANGSEKFEATHRKKDGSHFFVEVSSSYLPEHDGEFVCFVRDLTDRKQAEERIALLAQMLDEAPGSITVHDTNGNFIYANQKTFSLHGYDNEEEFLSLNLHDLDVPESEALVTERMRQIARDGEANFEVSHYRKDGTTFPLQVLAKGIEWNDKPALLSIASDITERIKMEESLHQAQKMEAIGTMAGGIAHDFNNILAAITGYSELALEDARQGIPTPEELESIVNVADRAKSLIEKIMIFSHKAEFDKKPINLNILIKNITNILERTLPKMIGIEIKLNDDLFLINGDVSQTEQVIFNLASNAKDAMPQGGRLTIKTENVSLGEDDIGDHLGAHLGDYVQLEVTDTGVGIDKESQKHMFEPFYTTKEIGKGTGMGLASVFGVMAGHDGFVTCTSDLGRGTTFKCYFPALQVTVKPEKLVDKLSSEVSGGHETILLVDDDEAVINIGSRILISKGYKTILAHSGEHAIEIYRKKRNQIDLVVMDLGMPGIGGHKALAKILAIDPAAKVVIASGYSADGQIKDVLEP
jgi:two-component system cell cycle sensor histidine kinase/response regulator CckA